MPGLVLLDDEQQRALGRRASNPRPPPPPPPSRYNPHANFRRADSSPRTNFTTTRADSADAFPLLNTVDSDADQLGPHQLDPQPTTTTTAIPTTGLKISVRFILLGVAVGVALGVTLSQIGVSPAAARWISLPGDLFLRALKCLVLPYVFCAVAVAIGDIVFVGKVSIVGVQTLRMFALLWVSSAAIGMTIALLFRPLFRVGAAARASAATTMLVGLGCPDNSTVLALSAANASVVCVPSSSSSPLPSSSFSLVDVHDVFNVASPAGISQFTLSEELLAILSSVVSSNITASLARSDLLAVITFAMLLGAVAGRQFFTRTRRVNYLYPTLLQLRNALFLALEAVIFLSPGAVVSLVAGSFAANGDALSQFQHVYAYVLAGVLAASVQMLVVVPLLVLLLTRCNPYAYMAKMLRAYAFAFACSSSLATAPVTFACVAKARVCSQSLGNFVISIGVCSNLSAVGWYVPIAVVFLAESSGNGDQLTVLRLVGVFVLAVVSCAGTPPIPSGVLVGITAIYTSLFGVSDVPETFAFVAAVDFLVDRLVTVCDVNDDIMCLKVIAENTDETVTQEQLGERD